jgi:hypothetical protein
MESSVRKFTATFGLVLVAALGMQAQSGPTVTVVNHSGQPALVRLIGEHSFSLNVPAGGVQTAQVPGDRYSVRMRYGAPGHYRYAKGSSFQIIETASQVTRAVLTLHATAGNMNEVPSSEAEFAGGPIR